MILKKRNVIKAQQFELEEIENIFRVAMKMEKKIPSNLLRGKVMASLFYEPSTRTRLSFESAMKRLGGDVITTENAKTFSSKAKGETLEDSVRVISAYCDLIVLRYYKEGGADRAAEYARVPVINAGDGPGNHPTQALLDLYTIQKEFGCIEGLKIVMVGDLKNGRTVRSLAYFLAKHFPKNKIVFISPKQVRMKKDIKRYLDECDVKWEERKALDGDILSKGDVFYQTRVQQERFADDKKRYDKVKNASKLLIIDSEKVKAMKKKAIIMHPLPRNSEIFYEVDQMPQARYFQQAENGLYVRMALLKMILAD